MRPLLARVLKQTRMLSSLPDLVTTIWTHPANANRRLKATYIFLQWNVRRLFTDSPMLVNVWQNCRFYCFSDNSSSRGVVYFRGYPDFNEISFMQRYLRNGDGFIDVGANVGLYTIFASSLVGQTGPVLAIEADPILFQRLLMNIDVSKSSNVNASCCLASSHFGEDIFIRQADNTVGHIHMKGEVVSDGNKIVLPSRPVDHLVQAVAYAMGKIDVEGVEPLVLKGAERCLQDGNPPVWLIEMNGLLRNYGFDETELIRWMRARDFLISTYDAATNTISRLDLSAFRHGNILFIRKDRWDWVVNRLRADHPARDIHSITATC
jgi:FkbM family methyltransferase